MSRSAGPVLVDTSVWVKFFRTEGTPEGTLLKSLLAKATVATCAPIRAEVISGAPTQREFHRLRALFDALELLRPPEDAWVRIEEHRFSLARRGVQASLIDLLIALTAQTHGVNLWTLDNDFRSIASVIPVTFAAHH